MPKDDEKSYEDTRFPAIKIYGFARLLVDVTTDYARPMLLCMGISARASDIINCRVRPLIEIYEDDFFGIISDELLRLQKSIVADFRNENIELLNIFRTIQMMSDGRRRYMWLPSLAWDDLGRYMLSTSHAPVYVGKSDYDQFRDIYLLVVDNKEKHLSEIYSKGWSSKRKSLWDECVDRLLFRRVGFEPNVIAAADNLLLRTLANEVINVFDKETRNRLDEEFRSILSKPSFRRLGYGRPDSIISLDEIGKESLTEWKLLRADIKANFTKS